MSLFLVSCETLIRCVRAEGSIFRQVRFASGLSYRHHVGKKPLIYQTVGDLVDSAAERFPDRIAIKSCHENKIFTFKQVQEQTNKIAAALVGMGFQKGDRLALWGPNTVYWYLTFLASAKAGLISVLINSSFQKGELEYCLKKVGATGIVTASQHKSQNFYDLIVETCPDLVHAEIGKLNNRNIPSFKYAIITDEDKFKGALQWKDLEKFADKTAYELLDERKKQITPDDAFNLQFTSGTTGKPKGAFVSHYKYVNNSYYISKRYELYDKQHKLCLHVPLFHAFGTDAMICPALHSGATIIMPWYSFDPVKSLEVIEKEKCSFVGGTPTMHIDLINAQKTQNRDISSLEIAVTGGAICPPQLFKDILSELKVKKVKSIFGQTEACGVVFQSKPGDDLFYSTETVGFIGEHVEAKVVNKEGLTVPLGVAGELYVRGYCVMLGYWDDEVKTKEAIGNDGWLRTGDQVILREDGYAHIVGRLKDLIIRGGENIFPKEIEEFLNTHPDILENHVIGVSDSRMGEEALVCMKLRKDVNLTYDELRSYCKGKIAHFKIPRYMKIVDNFPKTMSGKIQKFKLKEMYEKEFAK